MSSVYAVPVIMLHGDFLFNVYISLNERNNKQ